MVIHMRAALFQLYLIFSMRYRVPSEKLFNPTLSANLYCALFASDDSEIVSSAKTSLFESSRLAHRVHSISLAQAQLMTSAALPSETGLPIDTLLGSRGDPCQRPPLPREPPPPVESGCRRCLRRKATRGCFSNGRGGGWGRVTHSRRCGDGDVRGGGLDFRCAAGGAELARPQRQRWRWRRRRWGRKRRRLRRRLELSCLSLTRADVTISGDLRGRIDETPPGGWQPKLPGRPSMRTR